MEKLLAKIGFDAKESAIYLTLLEHGPRTASFIAKKTEINRSSIYYLVDDLVKRKIIIESERNNVIHFSACPPADLLGYIDAQREHLKSLKTELSDALPEFEAMEHHLDGGKPSFSYFQGKKEVRALFRKTLDNKRQKLWAITDSSELYDHLGHDYFEKYTQERIDKEILLKLIRTDYRPDDPAHWQDSGPELRAVHPLPEKIDRPEMAIYLWDERFCAFFSKKEENFALLVESPEFYQTQKALFDGLWESTQS